MLSSSNQGVVWAWVHGPVSRHGRGVVVAGLGARTLSLVTGLGDACPSRGRWPMRLRPRRGACLAGVALLCFVAGERSSDLRGHRVGQATRMRAVCSVRSSPCVCL